ncbi:hypothetical protein, partial [Escherichia coli]|uniref:hypothetical protein n=1 Tax=Escherichia coli TaxID=562 RepID=UPI001BDC9C33
WKGWAILLRQKQKKLIMLPSETMIWQPEFTDKTLSRKPGAVHLLTASLKMLLPPLKKSATQKDQSKPLTWWQDMPCCIR